MEASLYLLCAKYLFPRSTYFRATAWGSVLQPASPTNTRNSNEPVVFKQASAPQRRKLSAGVLLSRAGEQAVALPQRGLQRSCLPQQIQARTLNQKLGIVECDPLFLLGEPRIVHLLLCSA